MISVDPLHLTKMLIVNVLLPMKIIVKLIVVRIQTCACVSKRGRIM